LKIVNIFITLYFVHQDIIYQNATIIKNSFSSLVTEQSLLQSDYWIVFSRGL